MQNKTDAEFFKLAPEACCGSSIADASDDKNKETQVAKKVLNIDLIVIDLSTCRRCVPTGDQLKRAVDLLGPVANVLGIELKHREIVAQTPQEAMNHALLSSPTIRLNGHDIAQDIRESLCESCGDLTNGNIMVDCREWHYRDKTYFAAPLPLLVEAIMGAMLNIDAPPIVPAPITELPANLQRYFDNKRQTKTCC